MQMIGVGQSKLFELEDAGLIDSVMSGGARLIIADSIYRLLIRDVVLSQPYGAPAKKAPLPWASFKTHDRVDGRKLRRTRTPAELAALARANLRRKERPPPAAPAKGRRLSELLRASARKEGPPLSRRGRKNEAAQLWINNAHVSAAGVSVQAVVAYLKGRVVRLAGGLTCPNCNHTLRAIDVVVDNVDLITLRCWNCHVDILCVESH